MTAADDNPNRARLSLALDDQAVRTIPLAIAVLGEFAPHPDEPLTRRAVHVVTPGSLDATLRSMSPELKLSIDNQIDDDNTMLLVSLKFHRMTDFEPASLARQVPALATLYFELQRLEKQDASAERRKLSIAVSQRLNRQLQAIIQHPEFKALESAWRGLQYLADSAQGKEDVRLHVVNCSKQELLEEFRESVDYDSSWLFDLCQRQYEEPSGVPLAAIVGNYPFDHSADDVELLRFIAEVAADSRTLFMAAASPQLLKLDEWPQIEQVRQPSVVLQSPSHTAWRALRDSEGSRFLVLALPELLARKPYVAAADSTTAFSYDESKLLREQDSRATVRSSLCWMNPAFVVASHLMAMHDTFGWCVDLNGPLPIGENHLPAHSFITSENESRDSGTGVVFSPGLIDELARCGLITIDYHGQQVRLLTSATLHQPQAYGGSSGESATADARLTCQLPFVLASSRVVHYLRRINFEQRSLHMEPDELANVMEKWASAYTGAPADSDTFDYRKPLKSFSIKLESRPEHSGFVMADLRILPQLCGPQLHAPVRFKFVL